MRPLASSCLLLVLVLVQPRIAAADPTLSCDEWCMYEGGSWEWETGYLTEYEVGSRDVYGRRTRSTPSIDGLGFIATRGMLEVGHLQLGGDARLGITQPTGLGYEVDLKIGFGEQLTKWARAGIMTGVGGSGAFNTLNDVWQFPLEFTLELPLGSHLRFLGRLRATRVKYANERQDGASFPIGDEVEAGAALRIGRRRDFDSGGEIEDLAPYHRGSGYYLGLVYREAEGAKMWGVVIGRSADWWGKAATGGWPAD